MDPKTPGEMVEIEIFDQAFRVRYSDPGFIQKVAQYVDSEIRAVHDQFSSADSASVAILAALNIAEEYHLGKMKQEIEYREMEALFSEPELVYVLMAQQGALRQLGTKIFDERGVHISTLVGHLHPGAFKSDQISPELSPLTEEERERRREKERERSRDRHKPHHTRRWLERQLLGVAEGTLKLSDKELKALFAYARLKGVNRPGRVPKS